MYLLTYSFSRWGDGKLTQFSIVTDDWVATLAHKKQFNQVDNVAVVFLRELEPLEKRRLAELAAAGVEVEE
jgi:hypothetical protein